MLRTAVVPANTDRSLRARGVVRRQALLGAAVELLAREGAAGVTHRAVAERAGTTHGSTRYYFATREAMLEEALRGIARSDVARVGEILSRDEDADPVAEVSRFLADGLKNDRDASVARYELFLEASRDPSLRDALRDWGNAYRALIASRLTASANDPEEEAGMLLNLLNGLLLEQLAVPRADFESTVLRPAIERFIARETRAGDSA